MDMEFMHGGLPRMRLKAVWERNIVDEHRLQPNRGITRRCL